MSQFNKEAVQTYIKKRDRKAPILFCGRDAEKTVAYESLEMVRNGETEGNTVIFQGAPGVGKTSLLRHLREAMSEECDSAELDPSLIETPEEALLEVLEQVDPILGDRVRQSHQRNVHGGLHIQGLGGGVSQSTTTLPRSIPTVRQLMKLLDNRKKPLVLFMDEAQNAKSDMKGEKNRILHQLHVGNAGKVFLIAGGLSDTTQVLHDLGISRPSSDIGLTLQPLAHEEVLETLEAFLSDETFAIDRGGVDTGALRTLVVGESMGWPQHLTNVLRSLGEELIRVGGRLSACDLGLVQQRSQARREEYYAGRTENIPNEVLAEIISIIPKGESARPTDIHKAIERAYQKEPTLEKQLPEDEAYINIIHLGILQQNNGKELTIPIPSMHDYIKDRAQT